MDAGIDLLLIDKKLHVNNYSRVYANAQSSTEDVLAKLKPASELSNISNMGGIETTKAIQSVTNAFDLVAQSEGDAEKATQRYGDVVTAVSKSMQYDFTSGIKELNEGIKIGGSSAREAGLSLEQYSAIMGALIERTGRTGSELATSLNMMIARTTQVKGLREELGVTEIEAGKAEKALNKIGLTAQAGSDGSFKNFEEILKEVAEQWNDLSDAERSNLAEGIAGNKQRNTFMALMRSMTSEQKLYNEAINSTGALEEANKVKAESLQGKLNTLSDTVREIYSSLMNSSSIKTAIGVLTLFTKGINGVISKLGAFPTVMGTVVAGLSLFSNRFRTAFTNITNGSKVFGVFSKYLDNTRIKLQATQIEQQKQIASLQALKVQYTQAGLSTNTLNASLSKVQAQLAVTTLKMVACKVATMAFQMALTMGLSLVIGKAIEGIDNLIHAQERLKESNESAISSFNSSQESMSNATQLLAEKKKLEEAITANTGNSQKQLELKSKLVEVEKALAKELPNSVSGYDAQGNAISTNNKLIQAQLDLKKKQMVEESYKGLKKNVSFFNGSTNEFEETIDKQTAMLKSRDELQKKLDTFDYETNTKNGGFSGQLQEDTTQLKLLDANLTKDNELIAQRRVQILQLLEAGQSYSEISSQIGISEEVLKKYTAELENAGDASQDVSSKMELINSAIGNLDKNYVPYETIKKLAEAFPELGINADNAKDKIKDLKSEIEGNQDITKNAFNELIDKGSLSTDTVKKLAEAFPHLGINAENANSFLQLVGYSLDKVGEGTDEVNHLSKAMAEFSNNGKLSKDTVKEIADAFPALSITTANAKEKFKALTSEIIQNKDIIDKALADMEANNGELSDESIEKLSKAFPELGINAENASYSLKQISDASKEAENSLKLLGDAMDKISGSVDMIDTVIEEINDYGGAIKDSTFSNLAKSYPEILKVLTQGGDVVGNLTKLQQDYQGELENTKSKIIEQVNAGIDASDDLSASIEDSTDKALQSSNEKTDNEISNNENAVNSNADANETKSENDADYNQQAQENSANTSEVQQENDINSANTHADTTGVKSENDANFNQQAQENSANTTNEQAENYETDTSNHANAVSTKNTNEVGFFTQLGMLQADMVNNNSEKYATDLENFKNYILDKLKWLMFWKNSEDDALTDGTDSREVKDTTSDGSNRMDYHPKDANWDKNMADYKKKIEEQKKKREQEEKEQEEKLKSSYKPNFKTVTAKEAKAMDEANKEDDKTAKKAEQEAEKAQKELEKFQEQLKETTSSIEIDRYFSLNNSLQDIDNSLNKLKTSQQNMNDGQLADSQLDEIHLMEKKQDAIKNLSNEYENEAKELRDYLGKYSFTFDENGDFTNSQTRLLEIQDAVNNAYYEANEEGVKEKKANIEWVKQLQEKVTRLAKLMHEEIPKCGEDWEGLSEDIQTTYKTLATDFRNDLVEAIKKNIQDDQTAWEENFDNEENQYKQKEQYYNDKIKRLQEELDALNDASEDNEKKMKKLKKQLALWKQDDSALGKQKRQELNQQIAELDKTMKKDELQSEIDSLNKKNDTNNTARDAEKTAMEKHFKDLLDERAIYAKADHLILTKNLDAIKEEFVKSSESFKDIGTLYGENFSEAMMKRVQYGLASLQNIVPDGSSLVQVIQPFKRASADEAIDLSNVKHFATGGKVPKSVSKGEKLAFVGEDEQILNADDSKTFKTAMTIINSQLKDFIDNFNTLYNPQNIMFKNVQSQMPINNLNNLQKSSISNVTDNSKVEINNEFNITNREQVQADNMPKSIDKVIKQNLNRYGKVIR